MLPSLCSQVNWEIRGKIQRERENFLDHFQTCVHKRSFQFKVSNNLHPSGIQLYLSICVVTDYQGGKENCWSTKAENSDCQSHKKVHLWPKCSKIVGKGFDKWKPFQIVNHVKKYAGGQNIRRLAKVLIIGKLFRLSITSKRTQLGPKYPGPSRDG